MIIRQANFETDADSIIAGAKDFIARMDYTYFLPKTEDGLIAAIKLVLSVPGMEVTVAEQGNRIVGGLGVFYGPYIWNQELVSAEEIFWWTARDAPRSAAFRLLRSVMKDIKERGALATFKKLTSSPEKLESVYLKIGLRPMETAFMGIL